jgi:hypothetical protein
MNKSVNMADLAEADASDEDVDPMDACAFDPDGARTARLLRVLERLTEIGMELAETLAVQAKGQRDLQSVADIAGVKECIEERIILEVKGDFGTAFAKIARGVRLTVMLEDKLAKDWRLRQAGLEEEYEARRKENLIRRGQAHREYLVGRKDAVEEVVRETARRQRLDRESREQIDDALDAVWNDDRFYDYHEHDDWSVSETIAAICKDFGLTPDWNEWRGEDWAIEEAKAGMPGSPYAKPPDG